MNSISSMSWGGRNSCVVAPTHIDQQIRLHLSIVKKKSTRAKCGHVHFHIITSMSLRCFRIYPHNMLIRLMSIWHVHIEHGFVRTIHRLNDVNPDIVDTSAE